jgi:hypothetical protein
MTFFTQYFQCFMKLFFGGNFLIPDADASERGFRTQEQELFL